ncbi:hypothetical protein [Pseudomonas rubra]|uniref:DUF3077 domain-containing protein n=1 Tax=Pseudomonas rubra TaxID=2942627 RepID=A0ABT5PF53_9PSED|nr:hypothetical protein [Pseudomonas rubra]MDD1016898.1 hypothetical protein [Pseudomonas rubra]MDD1039356.1 hypothetical protein [Pseudomonas rubra]MDD1157862.1 hypothetical protein [Pseudomonas rubra]
MSEAIKAITTLSKGTYHSLPPDAQRAFAVSAALELIAEKVSNSPNNNEQLPWEMERLSGYVKLIQDALKV